MVLERISLPSTLRVIGCSAFKCCMNLKGVKLPDGLECIGGECFENSGLGEIVLSERVKEVRMGCFTAVSS